MMRGIAICLACLFLVGVAWLAVQVGDRSVPITDARIVIDPVPVVQGEAMRLSVSVFYTRPCQTHIVRELYDSRGERYAVPELVLPPGQSGVQHSISTIVVAPNFPVGEGRYVSHPSYGCNWFQRQFWPISIPARYAAFTVAKREAP